MARRPPTAGIPPTHPHSSFLNHRRSHSDIPFAFLAPPPPSRPPSDDSRSSDADDLLNEADSGTSAYPRHCRSLSMDSFVAPSAVPPNFEFGNGEFNAVELRKIATNQKLTEIALADPRRVKRILANRQSAARSKERKMRYISELEHKVQTLQTEATTLSAQLTLFQRDYSGLTSHNNELKFRLLAMEQQAKLRDALNDALTSEVQRLKLAVAELGESDLSNSLNQQIQLNPQAFQLQNEQKRTVPIPAAKQFCLGE